VEEVARLIGYDKIPTTLMADPLPRQERNRSLELEEQVREALVGCGLTEVITYSLTSLEAEAKLDPNSRPEGYLHIANPLSRERSVLRRSLLPGLLETVAENLKHHERVAIFELGRVYIPAEKGERPREPRRLGLALAGPRSRLFWHEKPRADGLLRLEGNH
jgi:phenylalanyl-tRNA synthetase beta chain